MIYKRKYSVSRERVKELQCLSYIEYPVVITKDEKVGYYEVWEAEEFDLDDLSIEVVNSDGKTLFSGVMAVDR